MAQTDVKRGQIAQRLMKEDSDLTEAVALAQADDLINQGLADVAQGSDVEAMPWEDAGVGDTTSMNEPMPWEDEGRGGDEAFPWEDEQIAMKEKEERTEWAPMPSKVFEGEKVSYDIPTLLQRDPKVGLDSKSIQEGFQETIDPLLQGALDADEYYASMGVDTEGYQPSEKKSRSKVGRAMDALINPLWAGQERLGKQGVEALPEERPSDYNQLAQVEDPSIREEAEMAIDERLYTPFLDQAMEALDKEPEKYEGMGMVEVARELAMDERIGDAAELAATVAMLPTGASAYTSLVKLLTKYTGKGVAQKIAASTLAGGSVGAIEGTLSGIVGNIAAGRDWDEGIGMDAAISGGAGVAAPLVSKVVGKAVDAVTGTPSAAARKVQDAAPRVAQVEEELTRVTDAGRKLMDDAAEEAGSKAQTRFAQIDEVKADEVAFAKNAFDESTVAAAATRDKALESLEKRRELVGRMPKSSAQRKAANKKIDEQIETVMARYDDEVRPFMKAYNDEVSAINTRYNDEARYVSDELDREVSVLYEGADEAAAADFRRLTGEDLFDGVNVGDFIQMRAKMPVVEAVKEKGGKVGIQTAAKQFDETRDVVINGQRAFDANGNPLQEPNPTYDFLMGARPTIEQVAGSVSGTSKVLGEATGLRTPGIESSRRAATTEVVDDLAAKIEGLSQPSGVNPPQVEEAIDYLRRRIAATAKGDEKAAKKLEKAFDKNINNMKKTDAPTEYIDELVGVSRDLKTARKVEANIGKDVGESTVAPWLAPLAVGADALLTGGALSLGTAAKILGAKVAQWLAKKGMNTWVTKSASSRFDELNKAFNGKLEYNEEIAALIDSGATPARVMAYLAATGDLSEEVIEMISE